MKRRILGAILATVLLSINAHVDIGRAGQYRFRRPIPRMRLPQAISRSGVFTGYIRGNISLEGKNFLIAKGAPVYFIGEGLEDRDVYLTGRSIFLSARRRNGIPVATMILVNPSELFQEVNSVLPEDPGKVIPSDMNDDVGELTDEAEQ